jgi:hypothetical protein
MPYILVNVNTYVSENPATRIIRADFYHHYSHAGGSRTIYQTTRRHISKDNHPHSYHPHNRNRPHLAQCLAQTTQRQLTHNGDDEGFKCRQTQRMFFLIVYYNQQTHNYIIKVYTTTVSLCNLYSYMFRPFHVTTRQFTTNALLCYTHSSNGSCWKYNL